MDQIVGIELDALKDEVVQYVEREERRIQENARIGVVAKDLVVVRGPGQGVERQHRPTNDVEPHLYVEAVGEERQFPCPPGPQRRDGILLLALRLAEHRQDCKDSGEDRTAGHLIDRGPVEPLSRHPGDLGSPQDQRERKHQYAVQPVAAGFTGLRIDDVTGNSPCRQYDLRLGKHGEDRQRGEKPRNSLRPGKLEKVFDAKPFNHDRIPPLLQ